MQLEKIVRRYYRRNIATRPCFGSRIQICGYVQFDPENGKLFIDATKVYEELVANKFRKIIWDHPLVIKELDHLADKIEECINQFLFKLATKENLSYLNDTVVKIAMNCVYELEGIRMTMRIKKRKN